MTQSSRKLRKNPDYAITTRELDDRGIPWTLRPPTGKGHPYLEITSPSGSSLRRHVCSSPQPRLNHARVLGDLRRWLRGHGFPDA